MDERQRFAEVARLNRVVYALETATAVLKEISEESKNLAPILLPIGDAISVWAQRVSDVRDHVRGDREVLEGPGRIIVPQ